MMDPQTIQALARERAEIAAAEGQEPFVYWNADEVEQYDGFPFPFLGPYVPENWREVDRYFCDSSGFGRDDEPALSARQTIALIRRRINETDSARGWAIVEAGQFQVWLAEYERTS